MIQNNIGYIGFSSSCPHGAAKINTYITYIPIFCLSTAQIKNGGGFNYGV